MSGKVVLDLGCGQGETSVILAQQGAIVSGIDIGENLIELSRRVAEVNEVECAFTVGSIHALPYENDSFDQVVGLAILHHLNEEGILVSLSEAHRVLKPGGSATFLEPVENCKLFDKIQSVIPVGTPGDSQYRPSILQRGKWAKFVEEADDRPLTERELRNAGSIFDEINIEYHEWLVRLSRVIPGVFAESVFRVVDLLLTHRYSPVKKLSRLVVVEYKKTKNQTL